MTLTISMHRAKFRGGYYWQVPNTSVRWSSDIGTAAREALELAEELHPGLGNVQFSLTS